MYSSRIVSHTEYDNPEAICRKAGKTKASRSTAVMASLMSRGTCEEPSHQYVLQGVDCNFSFRRSFKAAQYVYCPLLVSA